MPGRCQSRDFYIRQLWDQKGSAIVEAMEPQTHDGCTRRCAAGRWPRRTRAPATRSRSRAIWVAATASTGRWRRSRSSYADQNERDYLAVREAVDSGRLVAEVQG